MNSMDSSRKCSSDELTLAYSNETRPQDQKKMDNATHDEDDHSSSSTKNSTATTTSSALTKTLEHSSTTTTSAKKRKATTVTAEKPKRNLNRGDPHCLIWVCTHGKPPRSRGWGADSLDIIGVYRSREAAMNAKRQIMSRNKCYGRGDICIGGDMRDEIDLVVRPAPLFLEQDPLEPQPCVVKEGEGRFINYEDI